ncbi:MAG: PorT family protein [Ignavibacteria bacterium]|nr:PorT family protein [Ignavibacteria bacterium]MCC7158054.1 PorT family protein [Ignavibacteria bacterium]
MKLKTTFFAAVLMVLMAFTAYSQPKISLGPEFGINIANVTSTPDFASNSRTGFIFGVNLDMRFGQYISVQPGLRFTMKGYSVSDANGSGTAKANYFEIPILLKANFPLTEVRPYVMGGPVIGINMSSNSEYTPTGGTSQSVDRSSTTSGLDFNLLFGAGVGFKVTPKVDLFVQFGYAFGLSNVLKDVPSQTVKTTGIQLTAGALFNM